MATEKANKPPLEEEKTWFDMKLDHPRLEGTPLRSTRIRSSQSISQAGESLFTTKSSTIPKDPNFKFKINAGNNFFHKDAILYGHKHEQHAKMIDKAMDFSKAEDIHGLKTVIGKYTPGKPAVLSDNVKVSEKRMR